MKWQIKLQKISVEGDIKEKILKKLRRLAKYSGKTKKDAQMGLIKLSKGERWGYKVQMLLNLPGKRLAVTAKGKELLSVFDEVYERGARRMRKYYERKQSKERKNK